jgi:tRNA uracil 4-sulfurtransferase
VAYSLSAKPFKAFTKGKMLVLVRTSPEINLKSDYVRRQFMERLLLNMRRAIARAGYRCEIRNAWSRLFIEVENVEAAAALGNVFGISSYSMVDHQTDPNMAAMVEVAEKYKDKVKGKSFAIRAHRGDVYGFTSQEVAKTLGAVLYPFARKVDLENPEVEIFVDVRSQGAFFFSESTACPSGLPVGVQGKALCLISGGFDSAVAAWLLLKRGVALDFLFCNLAGQSYERSVLMVAKTLAQRWCYGYSPRFYTVDFAPLLTEIKTKVIPKYSQVVLKQAMYKVANQVARKIKAKALVTGEALGQVSSQTLHNLAAIDPISDAVIFRPLIGFDKQEIIDLSKKVGTFSLSQAVIEYCQITNSPITQGRGDRVRMQTERLNQCLFDEAFESMRMTHLNEVGDDQLISANLFINEIPRNSKVIDCREKSFFDVWHYPEAKRVEIDELLVSFSQYDKNNTYVLYCPFGLQSAFAAERMQHAGFNAYSFLGGSRALKTYAAGLNPQN